LLCDFRLFAIILLYNARRSPNSTGYLADVMEIISFMSSDQFRQAHVLP
jgi:hypothetical protein